MKSLFNRFYSDYLMPLRFCDYGYVLNYATQAGYRIMSVINYFELKNNGFQPDSTTKIIINRHDIDTDITRCERFFEIEKSLAVEATYYFRRNTVDISLMQRIEASGSEASYHFEELAAWCKRHRNYNINQVMSALPVMRADFEEYVQLLRLKSGLPIKSVASHGDYINRKLGLINHILLDNETRNKCGILVEAYDHLLKNDSQSISDCGYPVFWKPMDPITVIDKEIPIIDLLTHPRQWGRSPLCNFREDLGRIAVGLSYWLRSTNCQL